MFYNGELTLSKNYVVEIYPQDCAKVFSEWGKCAYDGFLLEHPEKVALVVFTGGHDVHPELYGEDVGAYTFTSIKRDMYEGMVFEYAFKHKIPMLGICRGAQFLCVKAGGKLVQDVNNHGGMHRIVTHDGKDLYCNSSHHQMQLPAKDAFPLAWAEPKRSPNHYLNGDNEQIEVDREYEVVYYPKINAVGIQYHPEWLSFNHPCVQYAKEVAKSYLKPNPALSS